MRFNYGSTQDRRIIREVYLPSSGTGLFLLERLGFEANKELLEMLSLVRRLV